MKYVVKARDLKWQGKTLPHGAPVEPKTDRDNQHIDLLLKIGKVEEAPKTKPVRHVATTRALQAEDPAQTPEPKAEAEKPPTTEDVPIRTSRYSTRRLTSED